MIHGARSFAAAICLFFLTGPAHAVPGVTNWEIDGSTVSADIALGSVAAKLSIRFENVVGLTPANLGLSFRLADPMTILPRFGSGISLPAAFPLVVKISPPADSGLSFSCGGEV